MKRRLVIITINTIFTLRNLLDWDQNRNLIKSVNLNLFKTFIATKNIANLSTVNARRLEKEDSRIKFSSNI